MTSATSQVPASTKDASVNSGQLSARNTRRSRSSHRSVKRRLVKALQARHLFRIGLVLLPLIGFVYVSWVNDVLSPSAKSPAATYLVKDWQNGVYNNSTLSPRIDRLEDEENRINHGYALASWVTRTIDEPLVSAFVAQSSERLPENITAPVIVPERALAKPDGVSSSNLEPDRAVDTLHNSTIYVVNEGGSLWRTGKRFIDDEIKLDRLIDDLAQSGMNVRNVKAGVQLIVEDLGSQGMRVAVNHEDGFYESHLIEDRVTTTMREQPPLETNSVHSVQMTPALKQNR